MYNSKSPANVVLIDFWGTWCPPCRKALPKLIEYQNRFGDSLQIIAANIDHLSSKYSVDQTRVQETLTELDCLSLTTIIDQESVFLKLFKDSKMAGIPTMMIIHHGVIVAVDYANPIEEALETLMKTQYRVVTKVEKTITTKKPVDGNIVVSTKSVKTVTTSPVSLIR
ncbi:thioredoxin-like protein [Globomyces pollinis-pini]|nr:thioredoxin-like protein [Globomyces pollinis-pini]